MAYPRYETLLAEPRDRVLWLTLNRPEALNTLSLQMAADLHDCLDRLYHDRDMHVIVLRGAGRAFCAGLDLKETASGIYKQAPFAGGFGLQSHLSDIFLKMRRCPQPIIALVQGPACGGGFAMALASDIRIAGESVRMSTSTIRLGLSGCEMGMSWFLPRIVGSSVASELMLTARFIEASRALATGLVSQVVPDSQLESTAQSYLDDMLVGTPIGLRLTKEGINSAQSAASLEACIALENRSQILAGTSEDAREARRAFVEKRKPAFGPKTSDQ